MQVPYSTLLVSLGSNSISGLRGLAMGPYSLHSDRGRLIFTVGQEPKWRALVNCLQPYSAHHGTCAHSIACLLARLPCPSAACGVHGASALMKMIRRTAKTKLQNPQTRKSHLETPPLLVCTLNSKSLSRLHATTRARGSSKHPPLKLQDKGGPPLHTPASRAPATQGSPTLPPDLLSRTVPCLPALRTRP